MIEPFATDDVETKLLSHWAERARDEIDLGDERQEELAREIAGEMLDRFAGDDGLPLLDAQLAEQRPSVPVLVRLAVKLARSRQLAGALGGDFHVSIVFAVYQEHNRLRMRAEHEHGENLLLRKIDQVEWLLAGLPSATWDMTVVDDGCPEASGRIAERILESRDGGGDVRVLFLERAIADGHPATRGLRSAADSQKGGSIQYGMAVAAERSRPRHVVVFTDADLSTHLGQLGLLVHPILAGGWDAAIGSRREPSSVVVKSGARDARGKLFIYLWKRLLPALGPIVDTQCGFKAFRADVARRIASDALEKDGAGAQPLDREGSDRVDRQRSRIDDGGTSAVSSHAAEHRSDLAQVSAADRNVQRVRPLRRITRRGRVDASGAPGSARDRGTRSRGVRPLRRGHGRAAPLARAVTVAEGRGTLA
jgi:hypothetical protein